MRTFLIWVSSCSRHSWANSRRFDRAPENSSSYGHTHVTTIRHSHCDLWHHQRRRGHRWKPSRTKTVFTFKYIDASRHFFFLKFSRWKRAARMRYLFLFLFDNIKVAMNSWCNQLNFTLSFLSVTLHSPQTSFRFYSLNAESQRHFHLTFHLCYIGPINFLTLTCLASWIRTRWGF